MWVRYYISAIILVLFFSCAGVPISQTGSHARVSISPNYKPSQINKVAILPFENIGAPGIDQAIADKFAMYFMDLGFVVVERSQLEYVLSEMNLTNSNKLSPSQLEEIGVQLKIDAILMGTMQYKYVPGSSYVNAYGGSSVEGHTKIIQETLRLVSISSGEVLISVQCPGVRGGSISEEIFLKLKGSSIKPMPYKTL